MKLPKIRRTKVVVPVVAGVAVLAIGATIWTSTADDQVDGPERDRVAAAAVKAAGGGTAVEVETSDDRGEAYEVEVRKDDGTEVEVELDDDLGVVRTKDDRDDDADDRDDRDDRDADDRVLSRSERTSAEKAALKAVGGGTVTDVEASDDLGVAYEVEVRDAQQVEWNVDLDKSFAVVTKTRDD